MHQPSYLDAGQRAQDEVAGRFVHPNAAPFVLYPAAPALDRGPNAILSYGFAGYRQPNQNRLVAPPNAPRWGLLLDRDLPRMPLTAGPTSGRAVGQPRITPAQYINHFFRIGVPPAPAAIPSGNLEVTRNAWGLTRLTFTVPERFWDGMVVNLTDPAQVAPNPESENVEQLCAVLTCLLANGFDPQRPPLQFALGQDNNAYSGLPENQTAHLPGPWPHGAAPVGMINGRNPGAQMEVPFLDTNGRYAREGAADQAPSLLNTINSTNHLRDIQLIAKLKPPLIRRRVNMEVPTPTRNNNDRVAAAEAHNAQVAFNPNLPVLVPIGGGSELRTFNHYEPTTPAIVINQKTRADGAVPVANGQFIPIRQNNSRYLLALYWAVVESVRRLREHQSGTADDPRYMTVGRIVIFFLDMQARGQGAFANGRYSTNRQLEWGPRYVGCNDKKYAVKQILGNTILWSPPSITSSNNCFFACLRYGRKQHEKKVLKVTGNPEPWFTSNDVLFTAKDNAKRETNVMRAMLKLEAGTPVDVKNQDMVTRICDLYKVSIKMYNMRLEVLYDIAISGSDVTIDLVYVEPSSEGTVGHVLYLGGVKVPPQQCGLCGKQYKKTHTCSTEQVTYRKYQLNKEKDTDVFSVAPPDIKWTNNKWTFDYTGDGIIYFDLETFQGKNPESALDDDDTVYHIPYSCGVWYGGYTQYIGHDVLDLFLEQLVAIDQDEEGGDQKTDTKDQLYRPPIPVCAWNGSRYDFKLVMHHILRSDAWAKICLISRIVMANGKLMSFTLQFEDGSQQFRFFDPCLWLMSSLDKACKSYGIAQDKAKGVFPHKMIEDLTDIDRFVTLAELNDGQNYFMGDAVRVSADPWTGDKLHDMGVSVAMLPGGRKYSLRDLHDYYLERDVVAMREICIKFFTYLDTTFDTVCIEYLTLSQYTFALFARDCPFNGQIFNPKNEEEYTFMRSAVYGGRVYPAVHSYQAANVGDVEDLLGADWRDKEFKHNDLIPNRLDLDFGEQDTFVREMDAVSLYPAALKLYDYPTGRHRVVTTELAAELTLYLSRHKGFRNVKLPLGIFEVKYTANRTLIHAVLPRRKDKGLMWDVMPGEGVYCSVDLEMACECHYDITIVGGMVWDSSGRIFENAITRTFAIKEAGERNKNPVERNVGKLMSNGLYGKLLQRILAELCAIVRTRTEWDKFHEGAQITDIHFLSDTIALAKGTKNEIEYNRPTHLGAFCLARSRYIMFCNFRILDPGMVQRPLERSRDDVIVALAASAKYTDTDSLYVTESAPKMIEGLELGELKDESVRDSGKIIFGIWLAKKVYAYIILKTDNTLRLVLRCKGISEPFLIFRDYVDAFADHSYSRETVNFEAIKSFGVDENAFAVTHVKTRRSFNKTCFHSRIPINLITGLVDLKSAYTVPHGNILDSFNLGEDMWLRYLSEGGDNSGLSHHEWGNFTVLRDEELAKEQETHKRRHEDEEAEEIETNAFQTSRLDMGGSASDVVESDGEEEVSKVRERLGRFANLVDDEAYEDD